MPVISDWKLTFDPGGPHELVLINFGDAMEGELRFPWSQVIQRGVPTRGTGAFNAARAACASSLSFVAIKRDHADNKAAKKWCLDLAIALAALAGNNGKVLKVEIKDDTDYYELASATLNDSVPGIRIAGTAQTETQWIVGGTIWSKVTP